MSCGHDHCTCEHHTDTHDTAPERHLPTISDHRRPEPASGCCGGRGHTDHAEPRSETAH